MKRVLSKLLSKQLVGPETTLYTFENNLGSWKSGQFIMVEQQCLGDVTVTRRAYSIANACGGDVLELLIECPTEKAKMSNCAKNWVIGQEILIEGPFGNFFLREGSERIVLIGSGTGLSPLRAMLQEALKTHREVVLIYSSKTVDRLFLEDELLALESEHDNLSIHFFVTREETKYKEGRITVEKLRDIIGDATLSRFYFCGSPIFVKAMQEHIISLGVSSDRLHKEQW